MDRRPDDALSALFRRLQDGDRAAIRPAFDALRDRVHALARAQLGDGADADDAAQQAIVKVFASASRYDPARPAWPWIAAVTTWECRTVRKRRARRREESLDDVL